ncbi:MAG TPA: ABC transporter ATP-binding protein [Dehalococcoidia bacterium]|nr:ABC transporter ATP-binding protein [Dehalococcoidia bacterium]
MGKLTTEFTTHDGKLRAVNDVSLNVAPGKVLAILGESGSGKSMLLRTILGIQPGSAKTSGEVVMNGVNLLNMDAGERERIRGTWLAMIFQDPMTALDPLFTVEQQIVETIRRHTQMSRAEASARALELLQLVQIPSPERRLKAYPFELSGGMRQRVVIAIALACSPSLLLADEPTTSLDVTVQARVLSLLRDLQAKLGMGMILVTHDLAVAAAIADDIAVMYAGRIVEYGSAREIARRPHHQYTQGLLAANVRPGQVLRPEAIPGSPPNLAHLPGGCAFAPRCAVAEERCWDEVPELRSLGGSQMSRCLLTA